MERQDGDDDLDLVAQALDEGRAQRPVDQPAGEDRVLGRDGPRGGRTSRGCGPRRTSAPRRRPSAGRSRSGPWGACRPSWPTAAWSRRRGRRRRSRRPGGRGGRSRTDGAGAEATVVDDGLDGGGSRVPRHMGALLSYVAERSTRGRSDRVVGWAPVFDRGLAGRPLEVGRARGPLPRTGDVAALRGRSVRAVSAALGMASACGCELAVRRPPELAAQTEPLDERAVAVDVLLLQVVEQPTALTDEQQQATTAVVVVLVLFRCSVRSAMRVVSSATWTSGEPVSPSTVAYSAMIFFLAVGVERQRSPLRLLRGAPGQVHPGSLGSAAVLRQASGYQRRPGPPNRAEPAPEGRRARGGGAAATYALRTPRLRSMRPVISLKNSSR